MTDRKDINDPFRIEMEKREREYMDEMKRLKEKK